MNYEDFLNELTAEIQWNFPKDRINFEKITVNKANVTLEGLSVRFPEQTTAATFYPKNLYADYLNGASISHIADNVAASISDTSMGYPEIPELTAENAAKSISFSLVSKEKNQELLSNCPYKDVHDMAAVPRWHLSDDASFLVNNDVMQTLRMTKEEILSIAQKNTESAEYTCKGMDDLMKEVMISEGMDEELMEELFPMQESPFYVISNTSCTDGSCAILADQFMQKVSEQIGTDELYLLPSSRHEMLAVNPKIVDDTADLKDMVMDVNSGVLAKEDFLSDSVYKYNAQTHSLSVCDNKGLFLDKTVTKDTVQPTISKGRGGLR